MSTDITSSDEEIDEGSEGNEIPDSIKERENWGESKNIFGTRYSVDLSPGSTVGGKVLTSTGADNNTYLGPTIRKEFERGAAYPEQATWIGYWEDKVGLRNREVGVPFNSRFTHTFLSGATSSGKTTVLVNNMVQLAYAGWGFCFIDPGGDAVKELLQRIPEYRMDDIIWIQPPTGEYDHVTALNFLEVEQGEDEPDATYDARVSSVAEELIPIVGGEEEMYNRMTRILRTVAQAMIEADEPYTLLDVHQLLESPELQADFVDEVEDPELRKAVHRLTVAREEEEISPLQGRIDKWTLDKNARRVVSHQHSSVDIEQAVEDRKIILVNTNPGRIASRVGRIIASAVVQRIWTTVKARPARATEDNRQPYFLIIDELNEAITEATDLEEMLEDARKFKLGLTLATQYPHQLNDDRRENVFGNVNNLMALKTGEGQSAREIMDRMGELEKTDLMNLSKYEMYTRVETSGGVSPPLRVQTFAPYPPLRDKNAAEEIIEQSLATYGTSETGLNSESTIVNQLIRGDGSVSFETDDDTTDVQQIETHVILESIYAADIRQGGGDNGYVAVEDVRAEVERRVDGDLGYVSKFANVIEQLPQQFVDMRRRSGDITIALTDDGRAEVTAQDTGSGVGGGGHDHKFLLRKVYELFTQLGCTVELPSQDSKNELPDAIADLPVSTNPDIDDLELDINSTNVNELTGDELGAVNEALDEWESTLADRLAEYHPHLPEISGGRDMFVEAESTTITTPGQTLQNLRKAVNNDKRCVFVVPDGSNSNTHGVSEFEGWAAKCVGILTNPQLCSDITDDRRKLYSGRNHLKIEEMAVLRPAAAGRTTTWIDPNYDQDTSAVFENDSDGDREVVLITSDGEELIHVTVDEIQRGEIDPNAVPAWGGYDRSRQEHVVHTVTENGRIETTTFDGKDEFKDEWRRVSEPFIPEVKFDREPEDEDWKIIILPDDDNDEYDGAQLFEFNGFTEDGRVDWSVTPIENEGAQQSDIGDEIDIEVDAAVLGEGDEGDDGEVGVGSGDDERGDVGDVGDSPTDEADEVFALPDDDVEAADHRHSGDSKDPSEKHEVLTKEHLSESDEFDVSDLNMEIDVEGCDEQDGEGVAVEPEAEWNRDDDDDDVTPPETNGEGVEGDVDDTDELVSDGDDSPNTDANSENSSDEDLDTDFSGVVIDGGTDDADSDVSGEEESDEDEDGTTQTTIF